MFIDALNFLSHIDYICPRVLLLPFFSRCSGFSSLQLGEDDDDDDDGATRYSPKHIWSSTS